MENERKILLIEDDLSICKVITHHLLAHGFQVTCQYDGPAGLQEALSGSYVLVILDLNLPRLSGIDVCKELRKKREDLPVIMLSVRDSEVDKVLGLEVGADDYIVKPFSMHELTARVRARLRLPVSSGDRPHGDNSNVHLIRFGALILNSERRLVEIGGAPLELTAKEFDVLQYLLQNRQRVISKEELLRALWGSTVAAYAESVSSLVSRLRRKLEKIAGEQYIGTVRGIGFRILEPGAPPPDDLDEDE